MEIKNYDFAGKKAIVRVDFNVPLKDGKIADDTRIRGAVPTLKLILEKGGALIIMSHMGKPKGKVKPELSLGQIKEAVAAALGVPEVKFAPDCAKADAEAAALKPGAPPREPPLLSRRGRQASRHREDRSRLRSCQEGYEEEAEGIR